MKTGMVFHLIIIPVLIVLEARCNCKQAELDDLILHNGKIVMADGSFSFHSVFTVKGNLIIRVGKERLMFRLLGPETDALDLQGWIIFFRQVRLLKVVQIMFIKEDQ